MVYIRKKKINGKIYYYLQRSYRQNGKVKTKHVSYIGKHVLYNTKQKKLINELKKFESEMLEEEMRGSKQDIQYIGKKFARENAIKRTEKFINNILKSKNPHKKLIESRKKFFP